VPKTKVLKIKQQPMLFYNNPHPSSANFKNPAPR